MKNTFQGKGPYCYRIVGDMLHRLNLALHPDDEQDPTFGQLYIFDPEEANNIRMNMSSYQDCDGDLLRLLEEEIRSVNIYAKSYNMIIDEEKKQENLFNAQRKQNSNLYLLFGIYKDKLKKNKRYEFPQENSVAAVFAIGPDGEVPEAQIVIHQKGKEINTLKSTNPHVEGLTYPLFFPEGLEGWITDMKANNKHISRQDVT
uniref:Helitron_like_N domain-containing protein n=1 Tax=Rhabditophanes sp. KR3021 TaxID=114890 RepID=A0AC35U2V6_9BILA